MSTQGMWEPSDRYVLFREALTLSNRLVTAWNAEDGRTPRGKRLRRLLDRANARLDRRSLERR